MNLNRRMGVLVREITLGLMAASVVCGVSHVAVADVSGFEHLREISVVCGKAASETVKPHAFKNRFLCSYESRLCKVLNKNELQFEAYISVDCEVKSASSKCPPISDCAKPHQLSDEIAEDVRRSNDPNFIGTADGALSPASGAPPAMPSK